MYDPLWPTQTMTCWVSAYCRDWKRKDKWTKSVTKYFQELSSQSNITQQELAVGIKEREIEKWINDILTKDSLGLCRRYKSDIQEIDFYEIDEATTSLIRCWSSILKLKTNNSTQYMQCNTDHEETLEYFLLHSEAYRHTRQNLPFLRSSTITN